MTTRYTKDMKDRADLVLVIRGRADHDGVLVDPPRPKRISKPGDHPCCEIALGSPEPCVLRAVGEDDSTE